MGFTPEDRARGATLGNKAKRLRTAAHVRQYAASVLRELASVDAGNKIQDIVALARARLYGAQVLATCIHEQDLEARIERLERQQQGAPAEMQ